MARLRELFRLVSKLGARLGIIRRPGAFLCVSPLTTIRLDQALSGTSKFVPPASDPAKAGSFHLTQLLAHEDTRKAVLRTPLDFGVAQPSIERDVSGHPLVRVQPQLG